MGRRDVIAGADFSNVAIGFNPPVLRGLEYWNYFGGVSTTTGRNLVIGKTKPSVVGSPAIQPAYATMSGGSAYVDTAVPETVAGTFLVIARANALTSGQLAHLISDYQGGVNGVYFYLAQANTAITLGVIRNNAGANVVQTAAAAGADKTVWGLYAGTFDDTTQISKDLTKGGSTAATVVYPRKTPVAGRTYRIGSAFDNIAGFSDIAWACIHSVVLTDSEIAAQIAPAKARVATLGITV